MFKNLYLYALSERKIFPLLLILNSILKLTTSWLEQTEKKKNKRKA